MRVVGVDAWSGGCVAVLLDDGAFSDCLAVPSFPALLDAVADAQMVAVDIPCGLPVVPPRPADVAARRFVGPRASSVFLTPARAVLEADTYQAALAVSQAEFGIGISTQAYALRSKIIEVEPHWEADERIIEAHPEVSFRVMAAEPLRWSKKTWNGQMLRRRLLADQGIVLGDELACGQVPVDDALDAAAAAWTALRAARGLAGCLPDQPPVQDGRPVAIWY